MKRHCLAVLLGLSLLFGCTAFAQTLPDLTCFSPGLVQMSELIARDAPLEMTAELTISNAAYARDLSVLGDMLDGTQMRLSADPSKGVGSLAFELAEETLLSLSYTENPLQLCVEGEVFPIDAKRPLSLFGEPLSLDATTADWLLKADGLALLERIALEDVRDALLELREGDALPGGYIVVKPFTAVETHSDDGERLTKIEISGAFGRDGEAPFTVKGSIKQPGGRSPKDTFSLSVYQDDANALTIDYSAAHTVTVTRKEKEGQNRIDTALKITGKIGGYAVYGRLSVVQKNDWTFDGESLKEKITVSTKLDFQDKTPGLRMRRLNDGLITLKSTVTLTTREDEESLTMKDKLSLTIELDSNTFLDAGADVTLTLGGDAPEIAVSGTEPAQGRTLEAALSDAARTLAAKLYGGLSAASVKKIKSGLE